MWNMDFLANRYASTLIGAMLVHSAPAAAASWSGSFVGASDTTVTYVQLIESSDGRVVGRLKEVSLRRDYKLRILVAPVSGAANGGQFVGKIEASWIEGGNAAISGRRVSGGILITGAEGLRISLRPGTEDDAEKAIDELRQTARRAIADGEAQRNWEKNAQALQGQLEAIQAVLTATIAYAEQGSYTYRRFKA